MNQQIINLGKVAITVDSEPWSSNKPYDRLVIVFNENDGISYISRKPVPLRNPRILQTDRNYWVPLGKPSVTVSFGTFTVLSNVELLPENNASDAPYLIDGVAYFWVETGGDTLDGKYQSVSIEGTPGKSAFELWQEESGDTSTTLEEWLESLKGEDGNDGLNGSNGEDGNDGVDGQDGADGKSAYEIWKSKNPNINWDEDEWLDKYVKGTPGVGTPGPRGYSAFEIAQQYRAAQGQSLFASEEEWLESLRGLSAFEIANQLWIAAGSNPYETESAFIESLRGPRGFRGEKGIGAPGPQGLPGKDGDSSVITGMSTSGNILTVYVTTNNHADSYEVPLPAGVSPNPNPSVVSINMGTLAAAVTYATSTAELKSTRFQWVLKTRDGNNNYIYKVIWHIENGMFIDVYGNIMSEEVISEPGSNTIDN